MRLKQYTELLVSLIRNVSMGAVCGYGFNYIRARDLDLPKTIEQYAQSLGYAGLTSGIIGGILSVIIPGFLLPILMRFKIVKRILDKLKTLFTST